ncbi:histidine phosphatase family protein [Cohnella sp. CFH 77786]|uniref:histidine phosphatase family protein n=1 Tax=Cohnella sp. CFH 77786 TaxID=2662265 RepID=UPI001C60FD16|nr:histidine phosphatase family protein [Cohnella sp. CFH 77786]
MTSLYFVRHAESDLSVREDAIRPLTKKGREDAKKVTEALKERNITAVYSSPYRRTIDTVKDISEYLGLEITLVHDLRERKVGEWVDDFRAFAASQWNDFDFKLGNGESLREVQKRNVSALYQILDANPGKNVMIGTHGTALSTILNHFRPDFGLDDFLAIADKMPYIECIQFEGNKVTSIREIEIGTSFFNSKENFI